MQAIMDRTNGDDTELFSMLANTKQYYYEQLIRLQMARKQALHNYDVNSIMTNLELIGDLVNIATRYELESLEMLKEQEKVYHTVLEDLRGGAELTGKIYDKVRAADVQIDELITAELDSKSESLL